MTITDNDYSERYYASNGQSGDRPALRYFERLARRYFRRGRVLDFGCGVGALVRRLSRHFEACGVESSDWARKHAADRGLSVTETVHNIESESLTGIISVHVVEHITDEDLGVVLSEWRRVLQPGGHAVVVTPDADGYAARMKRDRWIALTDPTHINLKGHAAWAHLFDRNGFHVLSPTAAGLWDFPYRWKWMWRLEVIVLGWPTLVQFLGGRPVLRAGSGESCILVLQKR